MSKPISNHAPVRLYSVDEVYQMIKRARLSGKFVNIEIDGVVYKVKLYSARFTCFRKNQFRCVSCGIRGNVMGLSFGGNPVPHFNLYHQTKDGELILMTKDHIIPRSKGGPNMQANYQTMCCLCNTKKGNIT